MWEQIIEVLKYFGTTALIPALVAGLVTLITTHFMSRNIESYKDELKRHSEKEIEQVKSGLQLLTHEHQIKFGQLHEKRAAVIADLYPLLKDVHYKVHALAGKMLFDGVETYNEHAAKEAFQEAVKLNFYFDRHKLLFSEELCSIMEDIVFSVSCTTLSLTQATEVPEERLRIQKKFEKELPELLNELSEASKVVEKNLELCSE